MSVKIFFCFQALLSSIPAYFASFKKFILANAKALRLGTTAARLKLKGIDGGSHKRWSMWLNA